jgi:peptidyl-prolyl cis-trans isomerase D
MLGAFRKASQSWPAKIFFGLLTLSFVGWGVGDVIRGRFSNPPAITVGSDRIDAQTVANEFRRDAETIQRQTGVNVTPDELRRRGFLNQTIQRLVTGSLLDQEGEKLGLAVDDSSVRKSIAAIPAFQDGHNAFDPNLYHAALSANGFTEARFEALTRRDIAHGELSGMVTDGAAVPDVMAEPIFRYRNERRVAQTIAFAASAMPAPAAPDQATLEAYHKDHAAQFSAPERRALTAIVLRSADLVADFKPTDDQVAKAYQDRQTEFTSAETRHIEQVYFADKDGAQKLVDAVKGGASLADAAKAAGKTVDDLGLVDAKSLPIESLASAAFAVDVPGVAGPVQTPLGWNVLYVTEKKPSGVKSLAEVRDQVVADLTKAEAVTRMNAASTKLEDAIGSGAPLEEIATNLNLKPIKVSEVDAHGHGADGKPAAGIPQSAALIKAAFATAKGSLSDVITLEDEAGYAVVRVDDVAAPAVRPFDSVKDAVMAAWTLDRQKEEAEAAANAAVERLNHGEAVDAVAGSIKPVETAPFTRAGDDATPAPVVSAAFKLREGQAVTVPAGDMAYAVRLEKIVPADPKADAAAFQAVKDEIQKDIAGDLTQQYLTALQNQIGVKIQPAVIERQFGDQQ